MSERLIFSSTKYGPSVSSGRTTQAGTAAVSVVGDAAAAVAATAVAPSALTGVPVGEFAAPVVVVGVGVLDSPGRHPASIATPAAPKIASTSLRVRIRPTWRSSLSIEYTSKLSSVALVTIQPGTALIVCVIQQCAVSKPAL